MNRRDFGVGSKSLILSDDATVSIEVVVKDKKDKDVISSRG